MRLNPPHSDVGGCPGHRRHLRAELLDRLRRVQLELGTESGGFVFEAGDAGSWTEAPVQDPQRTRCRGCGDQDCQHDDLVGWRCCQVSLKDSFCQRLWLGEQFLLLSMFQSYEGYKNVLIIRLHCIGNEKDMLNGFQQIKPNYDINRFWVITEIINFL